MSCTNNFVQPLSETFHVLLADDVINCPSNWGGFPCEGFEMKHRFLGCFACSANLTTLLKCQSEHSGKSQGIQQILDVKSRPRMEMGRSRPGQTARRWVSELTPLTDGDAVHVAGENRPTVFWAAASLHPWARKAYEYELGVP